MNNPGIIISQKALLVNDEAPSRTGRVGAIVITAGMVREER